VVLSGVVKGIKPRREREMEIQCRVEDRRAQDEDRHEPRGLGPAAITGRSFSASVAIRKPRNIAPPSP